MWDAEEYGETWADEYDKLVSGHTDAEEAVRAISGLDTSSGVLEMGVGTGRIALLLAGKGVSVHGVDVSSRMLEILKSKSKSGSLVLHRADFTEFELGREFSVIFMSRNTLIQVPTQDKQCLAIRSAARHLSRNGTLAIDLGIPPIESLKLNGAMTVTRIDRESVTAVAGSYDQTNQQAIVQRIRFTPDGSKMGHIMHRYIWPSELDLMCRLAGLELTGRYEDWAGSPFTQSSLTHVSYYRHSREAVGRSPVNT